MNHSELMTPCCTRCLHTVATPCVDAVACVDHGPICHDDDACRALRAARLARVRRGGDVMTLYVGAGTCGRANGALAVIDKIDAYFQRRGLRVPVVETGCVGYCQREVFVDLVTADGVRLSYCDLGPETIDEFLQTVFGDGELLNRFLLGRYDDPDDLYRGVRPIGETPFFARQTKVVLANCGVVDPASLDAALAAGGFRAAARALATMTPAEVCDEVIASGLRGRGGGGFPTGRKWKFALDRPRSQKYLICNADEGDPGAFMDRAVIEGDPFRMRRGHAHRRLRHRRDQGLRLHPRRVPAGDRAPRRGHPPGRAAAACWAETSSAASSTSTSPSRWAPGPSSAARRRADPDEHRGQARHAATPPALSRGVRPFRQARRSSTTSRRWPTCRRSCDKGAEWFARPRARRPARAPRSSPCPARCRTPASSRCRWAPRCARSSTTSAAASPAASTSRPCRSAAPPAAASPTRTWTSRSTTRRSRSSAR